MFYIQKFVHVCNNNNNSHRSILMNILSLRSAHDYKVQQQIPKATETIKTQCKPTKCWKTKSHDLFQEIWLNWCQNTLTGTEECWWFHLFRAVTRSTNTMLMIVWRAMVPIWYNFYVATTPIKYHSLPSYHYHQLYLADTLSTIQKICMHQMKNEK